MPGFQADHAEDMVPSQCIHMEVQDCKAVVPRAMPGGKPSCSVGEKIRGDKATIDQKTSKVVTTLESSSG